MFCKIGLKNLSFYNYCSLVLILLMIKNIESVCVGFETRVCLDELSEDDVTEKLEYVLSKYEEAEMKIPGKPINVRGKHVRYGDSIQEIRISFRYLDKTEYDIIQHCNFVIRYIANECESIETICNSFLPRTPRPLLQKERLQVCEDGVAKQFEAEEVSAEPMAEIEQVTEVNK